MAPRLASQQKANWNPAMDHSDKSNQILRYMFLFFNSNTATNRFIWTKIRVFLVYGSFFLKKYPYSGVPETIRSLSNFLKFLEKSSFFPKKRTKCNKVLICRMKKLYSFFQFFSILFHYHNQFKGRICIFFRSYLSFSITFL